MGPASPRLRVATWNLKQAVAPRARPEVLWHHTAEVVGADLVVFTEARVPRAGVPDGWTARWHQGGIGPRRTWGTVLAGRGVELRAPRGPSRADRRRLARWAGSLELAEVVVGGRTWGLVVGVYGLTRDLRGRSVGHGGFSVPAMLGAAARTIASYDRVVVAGDLNLLPADKPPILDELGLVDVVEHTADRRPRLEGCHRCSLGGSCGHLWTHRNGTRPGAKAQNIDYVFVSACLVGNIDSVRGGIGDFPDAWDLSDHAPVVVDLVVSSP